MNEPEPTGGAVDATAVVVTYNSCSEIADCLGAIADSTTAVRTIVVDNASGDGTPGLVRDVAPWARLVEFETNLGYSDAHNLVIGEVDTPALVLINPDCVVERTTIERLVRTLEEDPSIGAVSAMLRNPDGSPQSFARRDMDLRTIAGDLTWAGRSVDRRWRRSAAGRRRRYEAELATAPEHLVEVDCPAAACVALRRSVLPDPLLRSDLPLMFSDSDLYARLRSRGFRVVIDRRAGATHGHGTTIRRLQRGRYRAEFVRSAILSTRDRWSRRRRAGAVALFAADAGIQGAMGAIRRDRHLMVEARGTLGGLGFPGGTAPWLSARPTLSGTIRGSAGSVLRLPRDLFSGGRRTAQRVRFLIRARIEAWLSGCELHLDIHPTAVVEPGVHLDFRGPRVELVLAENARIRSGAVLRLWGGRVSLGAATEVRHTASLTTKGTLRLGPRCLVGRGVSVHADGTMVWSAGVTVAEMASVVDSEHTFGNGDVGVFDNPVLVRDVTLGSGCFIGARAQISSGVSIGRGAVIGANSVVTQDVDPHSITVGAPARVIGFVHTPTREAPS